MFTEYCTVPFEVEPVEVLDSFGESHGEVGTDTSPTTGPSILGFPGVFWGVHGASTVEWL
jgi:hypothetical protein